MAAHHAGMSAASVETCAKRAREAMPAALSSSVGSTHDLVLAAGVVSVGVDVRRGRRGRALGEGQARDTRQGGPAVDHPGHLSALDAAEARVEVLETRVRGGGGGGGATAAGPRGPRGPARGGSRLASPGRAR